MRRSSNNEGSGIQGVQCMVVDFHTHVFPDKVAPHVVENLKEKGGLVCHSEGTVNGLRHYLDMSGIDYAVAMGVAIRPDLVKKTNDWLTAVDDERVIPFASIHPDYPDPAGELDRLRENGIKGLKFHSPFQQFRPDEKRMMRIYEAMGQDMIAFFHAGSGLSSEGGEVLATSASIAAVRRSFPRLKMVAAHFGSYKRIEDAWEHLIGKDLYLDTSWAPTLAGLDVEEVRKIINRHGYENVVFGSDFPVSDPLAEIQVIVNLGLEEDQRDAILGGNARRLLSL